LGLTALVDLNQVECVVGCIRDHDKWVIIDQSESLVHT
jgi:hypothetical protein